MDRSIDGPEPFVQTNIVGALRLLEATKTFLSKCTADRQKAFRFLHVSTDEVYGSLTAEDPAFCESTPTLPIVRILLRRQRRIIWRALITTPLACRF